MVVVPLLSGSIIHPGHARKPLPAARLLSRHSIGPQRVLGKGSLYNSWIGSFLWRVKRHSNASSAPLIKLFGGGTVLNIAWIRNAFRLSLGVQVLPSPHRLSPAIVQPGPSVGRHKLAQRVVCTVLGLKELIATAQKCYYQ